MLELENANLLQFHFGFPLCATNAPVYIAKKHLGVLMASTHSFCAVSHRACACVVCLFVFAYWPISIKKRSLENSWSISSSLETKSDKPKFSFPGTRSCVSEAYQFGRCVGGKGKQSMFSMCVPVAHMRACSQNSSWLPDPEIGFQSLNQQRAGSFFCHYCGLKYP